MSYISIAEPNCPNITKGTPEAIWTGISCSLHISLLFVLFGMLMYYRKIFHFRKKSDWIQSLILIAFIVVSLCIYKMIHSDLII